ncbi:MAG: ThiF family adenylyltransferase, partial [Candidatus Poseidoniaceae archaeon]|nr:ThiF family adenylyltransferase [Candidatus Poseidoniaceae archaeon]
MKQQKMKCLLIGAGGIGSQLLDLLIPALTAGDMVKRMGGVQIDIMDDDRVEVANLAHQRHEPRMVGRLKVDSLAERLAPYLSTSLSLTPMPEKLLVASQLDGYDLIVVAVD